MATLSNFLERVSMIMLLSAISSPLSSMKGSIPFLERCLHLWSTFCNKMQTLELEYYSLFYIWQSSPLSDLVSKVCPGEIRYVTEKPVDVHKLNFRKRETKLESKLNYPVTENVRHFSRADLGHTSITSLFPRVNQCLTKTSDLTQIE